MAKTATISSKGQITLPKELRDKYHLQEGETAVVVDAGKARLSVIVFPISRHTPLSS